VSKRNNTPADVLCYPTLADVYGLYSAWAWRVLPRRTSRGCALAHVIWEHVSILRICHHHDLGSAGLLYGSIRPRIIGLLQAASEHVLLVRLRWISSSLVSSFWPYCDWWEAGLSLHSFARDRGLPFSNILFGPYKVEEPSAYITVRVRMMVL
jgi:hypothetical protein